MKKKILVIDDSRLQLEIATRTLEEAGYEVLTAGDGKVGLEKLRSGYIDLIILDLVLPGMDGFTFLSICKNDHALENIPVVVLTNRDSEEEIESVKKAGAVACFVKYKMPYVKLKEFIKTLFTK
jgi:CheY-like chemotaxis protein